MVVAILKVDEGGGCEICHLVVKLRLIRRRARHIVCDIWLVVGVLKAVCGVVVGGVWLVVVILRFTHDRCT